MRVEQLDHLAKSASDRVSRSTLYTTTTSTSPWRISPSKCWSAGRSMLAPEIPPSS